MSERPVQSVFFWRADMATPFRAVYGRIDGNLYSKDFHQIAADPARAMERALGVPERGQIPITWMWPGGQRTDNSQFKPGTGTDTRSRVHWPFGESPDPWRLTPTPTEQSVQVIAGTPGAPGVSMPPNQEQLAEAELNKISADGERPWYVAVHLFGEGAVLHARTFLEKPKAGHEYASWNNLPERVKLAMERLRKSGHSTGYVEFEQGLPMSAGQLVSKILAAFDDNPNVLLVGPPGTGKTVAMEQIIGLYSGSPSDLVTFDPDRIHGAFSTAPILLEGKPTARSVVFHPSYAYEHFVMGLLPDVANNSVTVKPHVGPLLELAQFAAAGPPNKALLVIDEFNRGNAAAIFGDMLGLIDRDKRDVASIDTPYAHLEPATELGQLGKTTTLPKDLLILAAMNSADRSVAPIDAALRRRFSIIHVDPDLDVLRDHLNADFEGGFKIGDPDTWQTAEHIAAVAVTVLEALNDRINFVLGRDFLLGQSVFWHLDVGSDNATALNSLAAAIDNQVLGTLALSFTDDDDGLAAVLCVTDSNSGPAAAKWKTPPSELIRWPGRLQLARFQDFSGPDLRTALVRLINPIPGTRSESSKDFASADTPTAPAFEHADHAD